MNTIHPLAFQTTWLLGAASAGDRIARAALAEMYPALVAELSWGLEQLRSGVVNSVAADIDAGMTAMNGGLPKLNGETCTASVIRCLRERQREYAVRAVAAGAMTLPADKLVPLLKEMLAVMERHEKPK